MHLAKTLEILAMMVVTMPDYSLGGLHQSYSAVLQCNAVLSINEDLPIN